jgi:hypothetical protein
MIGLLSRSKGVMTTIILVHMRLLAWIAGAAATFCAMFLLPWSYYGEISFGLSSMPGWGFYAAVAGAHVALAFPRNEAGLLTLVSGGVTVALAILVMLQYDNGPALFGPIMPAISAGQGSGGYLALLGALLTTAAQFAPSHAQTTAESAQPLPTTAPEPTGPAESPAGNG